MASSTTRTTSPPSAATSSNNNSSNPSTEVSNSRCSPVNSRNSSTKLSLNLAAPSQVSCSRISSPGLLLPRSQSTLPLPLQHLLVEPQLVATPSLQLLAPILSPLPLLRTPSQAVPSKNLSPRSPVELWMMTKITRQLVLIILSLEERKPRINKRLKRNLRPKRRKPRLKPMPFCHSRASLPVSSSWTTFPAIPATLPTK